MEPLPQGRTRLTSTTTNRSFWFWANRFGHCPHRAEGLIQLKPGFPSLYQHVIVSCHSKGKASTCRGIDIWSAEWKVLFCILIWQELYLMLSTGQQQLQGNNNRGSYRCVSGSHPWGSHLLHMRQQQCVPDTCVVKPHMWYCVMPFSLGQILGGYGLVGSVFLVRCWYASPGARGNFALLPVPWYESYSDFDSLWCGRSMLCVDRTCWIGNKYWNWICGLKHENEFTASKSFVCLRGFTN